MATAAAFQDIPHPEHHGYMDGSRYSRHPSHKANLSGVTMLDMLNGPEGSIASAYHTANSRHSSSKSTHPSRSSSTKTQLQQTNRTLVEMVHNFQSELEIQRKAMIEMQLRILQLEGALYSRNMESAQRAKQNAAARQEEAQPPSKKTMATTTTTTRKPDDRAHQQSWNTHQTHAHELESSPTKPEFWKSPTRFSGFNFNFDLLETVPQAPVAPHPVYDDAPEVCHISRSTPKLVRDTRSKVSPPPAANRTAPTPKTSTPPAETGGRTSMYHEAVSNIKEHVVEFEKVKMPFPPLLHSPPRTARARLVHTTSRDDEGLTALPRMPPPPTPESEPETPPRVRKGIKSMLIYRTISKSLKADSTYSLERRSSR
ncbi:uncharacterized protein SETTUDRAFT_30985 [Exserohilum turcica Et28A]|uniref:Uncharacterized protein n=1 Tax=Exserohilum turcicum (strain 28A) TaxID=671987 RepID=R0KBB4_EXST2|nr:uncharacterized protein SETTUDRAFT_30985 [Exserohilum turcica Et28A]EOA86654.1 hypothetical protein SETTUDRAFT_30985 [Exserohilum turcica Et28A]